MYQATAAYDRAPDKPVDDHWCQARKGLTRFLPVGSASFIILSTVLLSILGAAQSAPTCPPVSFPDTINLARNPRFEDAGNKASLTVYVSLSVDCPWAALEWCVHSNNSPQAPITTELVSKVPVGA